jgi:hypothetical protein
LRAVSRHLSSGEKGQGAAHDESRSAFDTDIDETGRATAGHRQDSGPLFREHAICKLTVASRQSLEE